MYMFIIQHGVSALMFASLSEDWRCTLESREEMVQVLVEKGADANLQNEVSPEEGPWMFELGIALIS